MEPPSIRPTVLIVEDELLIALALALAIEDAGMDVAAMAARGEEAVTKAEELHPDVIVMDVRLAGRMDGIDAARIIRRGWRGPILFHSAETDTTAREAMASLGVLVPKPAAPHAIAAVVAELAAGWRALPMRRRETASPQAMD